MLPGRIRVWHPWGPSQDPPELIGFGTHKRPNKLLSDAHAPTSLCWRNVQHGVTMSTGPPEYVFEFRPVVNEAGQAGAEL